MLRFGVNYDVRWAHPYSVYDQIDGMAAIEKASSNEGSDCYDRYRVRMTEMIESCNMYYQRLIKSRRG